ncbi:type III-A CRISPR-associated protein Cas10/Csm1 [Methanosarcina sp. WH1]|uniref:type III-A CRISPR-associated protein Cas10/Csm1 n=1 Tax=Methanosarcina sp. WH1 TaxID=1434102 RepID=UPI000615E08E|nr:type III-A CRISPR-associated protein Cas10/Csm1 [Methanosarcina sp. WH1]AKB21955.1 CRISPR-associated protein, Csm1 family [Methanosarcina sp. WH1]
MSEIDTDSDYLFLKVGALLHDIGHVVPGLEGEEKGHAERGFEFLSSFASTELFSLFAKYHHALSIDEIKEEGLSQKYKNLIWMVREASRLAAGDDGSDGEDAAGKHLLRSVFSGISNIKEGVKDSESKYYPSVKLDPKVFTYPRLKEDFPAMAEEGCKEIHESFRDFFTKLTDIGEKRINEDLLLMFLEKNTAFIPAGSGANNDISLFDHLKTTCAIASCMYRLHEKELETDLEKEIPDKEAEKYLLIGGDVSGIQDFIYRISSKGALRLLRGRSFYLEMFCEDIVQTIVERLGLPKANILYSGGGNFFILAPNTKEAKKKLEEIEKDLEGIEKDQEGWFIANRLSSSLYLALSWVPFCGDKFGNFSNIWMNINQENSLKKAQKYQSVLEKDPSKILKLGDNGDPCDACRKITHSEDLKPVKGIEEALFCPLCRDQMEIGSELAKLGDSFYILKTEYGGEGFSVPFGTMKIMDKDKMGTVSKSSTVYAVNSFDTDEIINMFKSKKMPQDIHLSPLPIAIYCAKPDDRKNDRELLTFEELAEKSQGSKKLGAVRMDVDNLGKIFTLGLHKNQRTITRISSLSRMMNYFFKGYLNLLGEFEEETVLDVCNWQSNSPKLIQDKEPHRKRKPYRNISIIYAGGDDLFILGAWDDVFELCFDIEGLFRKHVAENPHVTISAGFSIFNNKHPLYQIARVCGTKEECSKDEGRNRIYLLNRGVGEDNISDKFSGMKESIGWDEARKLFADFKPIFWYIMNEKGNPSKSMVRKLLDAREVYCKDPEKANWVIQLHYFVSRNKDLKRIIDSHEELRKYFYSVSDEKVNPIYDIDLPLNILDLQGRKVNS